MKMKRLLVIIFFLAAVLTVVPAWAQEPVKVEVFEQLTCPHCQAEKAFLTELQSSRDDFVVTYYELGDPESYQLWDQFTELEGLPKVSPITLVGTTVVQGFGSDQTTGQTIIDLIQASKDKPRYTFAELIAAGGSSNVEVDPDATCADGSACSARLGSQPWLVSVPFVGVLDVKTLSLPAISILLGFIDGFNPCAMWVLVTFLLVLAQLGSRRKMWEVAGLFIVAQAVMYYLILNVWFTAWDFIGLDRIITPIIGVVAIAGGLFFLYEWKKSDGTCKVTNLEQRSKISKRIHQLVSSPLTWVTAAGIIGLALSVNIIEFACSIGVPQAFTKIIELNQLNFWWAQLYMGLYILFYVIDDLLIFAIALYSFDKIGLTGKYSRWSNLIGGVLMVLLGLLLIFKREWLIFF